MDGGILCIGLQLQDSTIKRFTREKYYLTHFKYKIFVYLLV